MSAPQAPARVREMVLADCDRVALIRVRGWQSAYRGLMPQPYLDAMDPAADVERRRSLFARPPEGVVNLVAEDEDGEVVGWACHGPYRDGEVRTADAELYALYVDAGRLGTGVGRTLTQESVRRARAPGTRACSCGCSRATPAPGGSTSGRASAPTAPRSPSRWTASRCPRCGTPGR
ncbi:GNAT superfamily N-acetyltransferase [Streptomyces tendae]